MTAVMTRPKKITLEAAPGDRPAKGQWSRFFTGHEWIVSVRCKTCGSLSTLLMYTVGARGRVAPQWNCRRHFGTHTCPATGILILAGWKSKPPGVK